MAEFGSVKSVIEKHTEILLPLWHPLGKEQVRKKKTQSL